MDIDGYSFQEFKKLAVHIHGFAAPGVMLGGYMMSLGKSLLPENIKLRIICESRKCLPDAAQLLSSCSTGNGRIRIKNLGRYAISLCDEDSGQGIRISLDMKKVSKWSALHAWLMQSVPLAEQDEEALLAEIEEAGSSICRAEPVVVHGDLLKRLADSKTAICPVCGEAYPARDGSECRGCQGENYFFSPGGAQSAAPGVRIVKAEDAVGKTLAHDMTQILPGQFKGTAFTAGQVVSAGDLCRLQQIGRFEVAVVEEGAENTEAVHENKAAELFAARMAGTGVRYKLPPHEGKIDFVADCDGLLSVDVKKLENFNLAPNVMCASMQDASMVNAGDKFAGTRAIPLFLDKDSLRKALATLGDEALFTVSPLRRARMGILVTGTEVFNGIIEDKFIPVMENKARQYKCDVVHSCIVPDDRQRIVAAVNEMKAKGVDLIVTTGGMSVDPGDLTRPALIDAGLKDVVYGMPILPGAMAMVGNMAHEGKNIQVMGVPACALFFRHTVFDLLMPRLLAGRSINRAEVARLGEGGFCLGCKVCTFPHCTFGR